MLPIPCGEGASLSRNPKSLNLVHLYACICFIKIVLEYWNIYYFKVFYATRIGVINAKKLLKTYRSDKMLLFISYSSGTELCPCWGKKINLPYVCWCKS